MGGRPHRPASRVPVRRMADSLNEAYDGQIEGIFNDETKRALELSTKMNGSRKGAGGQANASCPGS